MLNNMDLSLKNREWKEFLFPDIFDIKKGFYNKKPSKSNKGSIPFLGATQNNNGITEFYSKEIIEKSSKIGYGKNEDLNRKIFKGNCIAVTNNGSVGHAYYQKNKFTCSHDINPLYLRNKELNYYIAMFLITSIEKQKVCFEYARKWRPMRMIKSKILLPVTEQGEPDYVFMETFIREKEKKKIIAYKKYISSRIEFLKNTNEIKKISEKVWLEFNIQHLFETKKGNQNKMSDLLIGDIPLVSAKNGNNGLKGFVSKNNKTQYPKNTITLNNDGDGGAGIAFYQPFEYLLDSHVTSLEAKNDLNEHTLLFISRCITKQRNKFGHGYSLTNNRLKAFKIMLPINENNEPDYEYMENYMKQIELKKLKAYLEYKKANA